MLRRLVVCASPLGSESSLESIGGMGEFVLALGVLGDWFPGGPEKPPGKPMPPGRLAFAGFAAGLADEGSCAEQGVASSAKPKRNRSDKVWQTHPRIMGLRIHAFRERAEKNGRPIARREEVDCKTELAACERIPSMRCAFWLSIAGTRVVRQLWLGKTRVERAGAVGMEATVEHAGEGANRPTCGRIAA